ncbi:hypothetical protein SSX86_017505 [Deinandra increscens subsp. villosa]|uniref:CLAVATA3/ESR (CLE)-related protein 9 n=1 Tax=Deinandra increscens subsp. villosa TaxID=3103831 RepID=A0AAP0GVQ4_9ASTR
MKKSLSSIQPLLKMLIICFLIIITITTSSSTNAGDITTATIAYHPHRRHQLHDHNSCITISTEKYPSPLCNSDCHPPPSLRRQHQFRRPPPYDEDIDPRYGVSKRLVPSGPNPLHN